MPWMERRPRAGVDYPGSVGELRSWFPTDADCLDYLDWLRWPDGFVCPALRACRRLAGRRWPVQVRRLRGAHVGDGGHDVRPAPDAADGVVHGVLAVRHAEGRRSRR